MGKLTKAVQALGAAAVVAVASPAQAQDRSAGTAAEMFHMLVEGIFAAQVRNSPELAKVWDEPEVSALIKQNKHREAEAIVGQRAAGMYRGLFADEAAHHKAQRTELEAIGQQVARQGLASAEDCAKERGRLRGFVLRDDVLRRYDFGVMAGQNPGPVLRSPADQQQAVMTFQRVRSVVNLACKKFEQE